MEDVDSVFAKITETLRSDGFRGVEDVRHSEAFGSRYAVFAGPGRDVRLVWDEKESWFLFQQRGSDNVAAWNDIALERVARPGEFVVITTIRMTSDIPSKNDHEQLNANMIRRMCSGW